MYREKAWRQLHKNAVSNIEQVLVMTYIYIYIYIERERDEKLTGNIAYPIIEWKLFFDIQVSSVDHYIISATKNISTQLAETAVCILAEG